jgi:hypothetical protein
MQTIVRNRRHTDEAVRLAVTAPASTGAPA